MGFLQYATTPARPAHSHDGPAQKEAGPPARAERTASGGGNGVSACARARRVSSHALAQHTAANMAQKRTACMISRTLESKPTTSSMLRSAGSAMVKPVLVTAMTMCVLTCSADSVALSGTHHSSSRAHSLHMSDVVNNTFTLDQSRGLNAPPLPLTLSSSLVLAHDLCQWLICSAHMVLTFDPRYLHAAYIDARVVRHMQGHAVCQHQPCSNGSHHELQSA
jgi:hypothetical protein